MAGMKRQGLQYQTQSLAATKPHAGTLLSSLITGKGAPRIPVQARLSRACRAHFTGPRSTRMLIRSLIIAAPAFRPRDRGKM